MKNILYTIILSFLFSSVCLADCYNAESYAYDAYRDAKKAYKSSNLDRCRHYARRAKKDASYAESEASSCNCSDAESEAYDAYRNAKKAYNSSNLDECQSYARRAKRDASYAESEASSCD